jgi:hypothetical protein
VSSLFRIRGYLGKRSQVYLTRLQTLSPIYPIMIEVGDPNKQDCAYRNGSINTIRCWYVLLLNKTENK